MADEATRRARLAASSIPLLNPVSDPCLSVRKTIQCEWNKAPKLTSIDKSSFSPVPNIPNKPYFQDILISSEDAIALNRLISNFSFCKDLLARISAVPSSVCDSCGVDETNDHIIFQCDKFSRHRDVGLTWNRGTDTSLYSG